MPTLFDPSSGKVARGKFETSFKRHGRGLQPVSALFGRAMMRKPSCLILEQPVRPRMEGRSAREGRQGGIWPIGRRIRTCNMRLMRKRNPKSRVLPSFHSRQTKGAESDGVGRVRPVGVKSPSAISWLMVVVRTDALTWVLFSCSALGGVVLLIYNG
jgi:hypothetical protein